MSLASDRQRLVRVASRLDARGLLTGIDGNLSIRLATGEVLVTPTSCCKGWLSEDDLVIVSPDGRSVGRPTSELAMHLAIYAKRRDVSAIVHAHPPEATARAVEGLPLDEPFLSEAVLTIGRVPVVDWSMPGEDRLAAMVGEAARSADAMLLRFHGAVSLGSTIEEACFRMETLEHVSMVDRLRRMLGGGRAVLEPEAVEALERRRRDG